MSTETARQPAGVPVGGQFATTAKTEPDLALTAPALGVGSDVTTNARNFRGEVTKVHAGCPQADSWVFAHAIPIRAEALEPGYPWYSVKVNGGGAVCVPHYDIADAPPAEPAPPAPTEAERLTAAARGAFDQLMAADPRAGHALWESMRGDVEAGEYPELQIGQDEDGNTVLLDPDTGEQTHLIVEDTAFRWNRSDELDAAAKAVVISYDGTGDYETLLYRSGATQEPVRLPEGWTEESA